MSRGDFRIVTHPEKAPAVDFVTRIGTGPFIDTGVDVIMRSQPGQPVVTERVYLAEATIRQMAQMLGLSGSITADPARDEALIAHGKLEAMKENLDGDAARLFGGLAGLLHDSRRLDGAHSSSSK